MPKSKFKSKSEIESSNRSHAIANHKKRPLPKQSSGKTVSETSSSVSKPTKSTSRFSVVEQVQNIHKYTRESIYSQHQKRISSSQSSKYSDVHKSGNSLHANDPKDAKSPHLNIKRSLGEFSEIAQSLNSDEADHTSKHISKVSIISDQSYFSTQSIHGEGSRRKMSIHKRSRSSTGSIRRKRRKKPSPEYDEPFYIHEIKHRPEPVVDVELKTPNVCLSVQSESESAVSDDLLDVEIGSGDIDIDGIDNGDIVSETGDFENERMNCYRDILMKIRNVPDVNELDAEDDGIGDVSKVVQEGKTGDQTGKYRHPLAEASTDSETEEEGWSEDHTTQVKSSRQSLAIISSSEIEDDSALGSCDDDDDLRVQIPQEDLTTFNLTPYEFYLDAKESKVDVNKPILNAMVSDFLDEIITKVVGVVEKVGKLDKEKLMGTLLDEVDEYQTELFEHQYLSKRITEMLVRRCKYSLVMPSKNRFIEETNHKRCLTALNEMDYWLKREKLSTKVARKEVDRLEAEERTKRTEDDDLWLRLENLINNTILNSRNASDHTKIVLEKLIGRLRNMRNELSETRLNLILVQHTDLDINMKMKKINTIAKNLYVDNYMSLEAQVEILVRKLETRNSSVHKTSKLIHSQIHSTAHLRCRRKILRRKLSAAQCILESLRWKFKALRAKANRCYLAQSKLYVDLDDVRYQGGIKIYPKLLRDYDQTLEALERKRSEVEALRAQHNSLIERVEAIEEKRRISLENNKPLDEVSSSALTMIMTRR